jgi:prefoldin subunit 5
MPGREELIAHIQEVRQDKIVPAHTETATAVSAYEQLASEMQALVAAIKAARTRRDNIMARLGNLTTSSTNARNATGQAHDAFGQLLEPTPAAEPFQAASSQAVAATTTLAGRAQYVQEGVQAVSSTLAELDGAAETIEQLATEVEGDPLIAVTAQSSLEVLDSAAEAYISNL